MKRIAIVGAALVALVFAAVALAGQPSWYKELEKTTDRIAQQQLNSVPYPEAQMKDSLERRNLRERLIRFNKQNKVGYIYLMSFGKFVGYYVVKGKVSSTQSQMTNADQTWDCGDPCTAVVESMGDDGSFGPNEGGAKGVFFFTSGGVMVETTLEWLYSDAPLSIKVPNLLK